MKPRLIKNTSEEYIGSLPVLRQDVPTITGLQAELRRNRLLILLPMAMGICGVTTLIGGTGLLLTLEKIYPGLASGTPAGIAMVLLLTVLSISFLGFIGLPAVLPAWLDRQIRGREASFCDTQLIGSLIDTVHAIKSADSGFRKRGYGDCAAALLYQTLPMIGPLEAAALTDNQRDHLVRKALCRQSEEEAFVLILLRSSPVWGDLDTLAALLMLARTAKNEAIRAAAYASLAPLKVRLLTERENAALAYSLEIPTLPS